MQEAFAERPKWTDKKRKDDLFCSVPSRTVTCLDTGNDAGDGATAPTGRGALTWARRGEPTVTHRALSPNRVAPSQRLSTSPESRRLSYSECFHYFLCDSGVGKSQM